MNVSLSSNKTLVFSLPDPITDHYKQLDTIGKGSYGKVFKASHIMTGTIVAVKKYSFDPDGESCIPQDSLREVSILRSLDHINVLRLIEVYGAFTGTDGVGNQRLYVVLEYCVGTLCDSIKLNRWGANYATFDYEKLKFDFRDIISGVHHCHSRGIMHRDLKPQNILMGADGKLKIADFGLSRKTNRSRSTYTNEVITLWYRPIELLLGESRYSYEVDMWSVGCIFFECITSRAFFRGDSEIDMVFTIFRTLGTPTLESWKEYKIMPRYKLTIPTWPAAKWESILPCLSNEGIDFISKLVVCNPVKRLTANRALQHAFLN